MPRIRSRSLSLLGQLRFLAPALLWVATAAGCAANHTFPTEVPLVSTEVSAMVDALAARDADEDALFDLTWFPLLHLDLQVFTDNEDQPSYPEGHVFFGIRSWLPAFLIVDGDVAYYDAEHASFERNDFSAVLWGLWASNDFTLATPYGERVERRRRFLWLFDWEDSIEYARR